MRSRVYYLLDFLNRQTHTTDLLQEYVERYSLQIVEESDDLVTLRDTHGVDPELERELSFLTGKNVVLDRTSAVKRVRGVPSDRTTSQPAALGSIDVQGSVIHLIDTLLQAAIAAKASDIHFEPFEDSFHVRLRIDGVLQPSAEIPLRQRDAVVSRLKILSGLDIAEKRRPQDGRLSLSNDGRDVDFRVSTLPTRHGEKVVLRLLDRGSIELDMEALGIRDGYLSTLKRTLDMPNGIILVTGPTGSGKTTTLYASLQSIDYRSRNVQTIEDPVEYDLPGINQSQVKPDIGYTFAAALRAFLRQDPDVILVGEIRDSETAEIAVRSALTGHLVLSTLHTNDAPSTITRLIDMGIEPYLVASSLRLIIAQRLVRRICPSCRCSAQASESIRRTLNLSAADNFEGSGCDDCNGTGYRGRIALFEFLPIGEELEEAIASEAGTIRIRRLAEESGFKSLQHSARPLITKGVTTPEEVLRATIR